MLKRKNNNMKCPSRFFYSICLITIAWAVVGCTTSSNRSRTLLQVAAPDSTVLEVEIHNEVLWCAIQKNDLTVAWLAVSDEGIGVELRRPQPRETLAANMKWNQPGIGGHYSFMTNACKSTVYYDKNSGLPVFRINKSAEETEARNVSVTTNTCERVRAILWDQTSQFFTTNVVDRL